MSPVIRAEHASYFLSTCYTLPCHAISLTHHSSVFSECRKTGHKETWRLEAERPEEHETEECQGDGTQRDGRSKTGTQGEQVGKKAGRPTGNPTPNFLNVGHSQHFFVVPSGYFFIILDTRQMSVSCLHVNDAVTLAVMRVPSSYRDASLITCRGHPMYRYTLFYTAIDVHFIIDKFYD